MSIGFYKPVSSILNTPLPANVANCNPKLLKQLQCILLKNPEDRTHTQLSLINKFLAEAPYFQRMNELASLQLCKDMIKYAKIEHVKAGRTVTQIGKSNYAVYLVLDGRLGATKTFDEDTRFIDEQDKLNRLLERAHRFIKLHRGNIKTAANIKTANARDKVELTEINLAGFVQVENIYGVDQLLSGDQYESSTFTLTDSILLEIKVSHLMQALNIYKNKLLSSKIDTFCKACSVFSKISIDRLRILIQKCPTQRLPRGQLIYRQGQSPNYFYILKKGEVLLRKTIQLFRQDPNKLYKKRSCMRSGSGEKLESLPYADLQSVYNYQPQEKKVKIGILNEVTLFGQEEIFEKTSRQVSAEVTSNQAEIYCISIKNLQSVLSDKGLTLGQFKIILYQSITTRRILYRQQKLSELVAINNKNSMNYFFINPQITNSPSKNLNKKGIDKKQEDSLLQAQIFAKQQQTFDSKQRLRRFMRKLSTTQPINDDFTNNFKDRTVSFSVQKQIHNSKTIQQSAKLKKAQSIVQNQPVLQKDFPPTFHSFNFTKLTEKCGQQEKDFSNKFSKDEHNIAQLTHTVSQINQKVKQVTARGQKLGIRCYSIDIKQPLFELDYFQKMKKETQRINNNKRRMVYSSVASSPRISRLSTARPKTASTRPHSASTMKTLK